MNRLIERCKAESMNVDAGLPQEVARLAGTYGWVRPLTQAIGYKESMPDPEGTVPNPDKIRRAILANTIGFVWSQSEQFRDVKRDRAVPLIQSNGRKTLSGNTLKISRLFCCF